jgi:metalloendopeptidase OMA1, mitochondrial
MRPIRPAAWWCAAAFVVAGCTPPGGQGEGPGHRAQRLALTPDQEVKLGEEGYREVLSKSRVLPASSPQVRTVREVGERIERAVAIEPLRREINLHLEGYHFEWEFNVLQKDAINAFCMPGGKVAVFTGLLPVTQNEDQLATVMGHEIAHALAHHASERIARQESAERKLRILSVGLGGLSEQDRRRVIGVLAAGAQFGSLSYDRKQESEADHIGLFLMTFAGYDPHQAVAFWERMQQATAKTGRPPEILSDHPSDARRIAQIRVWADQAQAGLKAYKEGRIAPAPGR